jgi:hypothetical protein
MNLKYLTFPLIFAAALSCSRESTVLATKANPGDFDGVWTGKWSWKPTESTSLEVFEGRVRAKNYPIRDLRTDETVVVSVSGKATFESEYGSPNAPCVLLDFPNEVVTPIFISRNKKRLIYRVSAARDWNIIFERTAR